MNKRRRRYKITSERVQFFNEQAGIPVVASQDRPKIVLFDYTATNLIRRDIDTIAACAPFLVGNSITWVDMRGLGGQETWRELQQVFHLHPLALEDIIHVPQRPHIETYDQQLVIITNMMTRRLDRPGFVAEQISLILGKTYLVTIQEEPDYDCLDIVRQRLQTGYTQLRQAGADYLVYALLDAIIDGFFPILEMYGDILETIEDEVTRDPDTRTLERIYDVKRELLILRRSIWPMRDLINELIRSHHPLISDDVRVYLRDCYDHTIQVFDVIETYRELISSLTDIYLSFVSNRMNEIMKVLTIISSIFIPLTFIAGIYGMNFNPESSPWNMPELNWYWGYPLTWLVMLSLAGGMGILFWRMGWLTSFATPRAASQKRDP
ncbi:MAG: magnesium/cobalt transporter CorA [Synechococcales cyanobacterium]